MGPQVGQILTTVPTPRRQLHALRHLVSPLLASVSATVKREAMVLPCPISKGRERDENGLLAQKMVCKATDDLHWVEDKFHSILYSHVYYIIKKQQEGNVLSPQG